MNRPIRALLLVNGLGLGNSTRCHAIIQRLSEYGFDVAVIISGNGQWYFEGRPEVPKIHGIEAFYYASTNGRISILRTLMSAGDRRRIAKRNAKTVEQVIDTYKPDIALFDAVYTTQRFKRRGIPIVALNNADVVHQSYRRFTNQPSSTRMQFHAIEEMDYLFQRLRTDLLLSPNLDGSLPEVGGNVKRIGPIVRRGYSSSGSNGGEARVVIMLSGSRFGSHVALSDRRYPFHIDIVGRDVPADVSLPPVSLSTAG
jgi:UDP:flavonoid glycosyltransferase YjiC (YdhE family)